MNPTEPIIYGFGEFRLDPQKMMLSRSGEVFSITPKALEILVLLIREREKIVTREHLMESIWPDTFVEEGNINYHISGLRKLLGENGTAESKFIQTFPKKGYKFVAEITESPAGRSSISVEANNAGFGDTPATGQTLRWLVGVLAVLFFIGFAAAFMWDRAGDSRPPSTARMTENAEAYRSYLRGKQIFDRRAFTDESPIDHFLRSIELDPNFTAAHLAMADAFATQERPEKAEAALVQVFKLEPNSAGAYATRGFIRMFHYWDWAGAEAAFDKAVELDPKDAKTRHWLGVYLSLVGRLDEAKVQMRIAEELDPTSLIIASDIGELYYFSRDYDRADAQLKQVLSVDAKFSVAHRYMADVKIAQGDEKAAFNALMNSTLIAADDIGERVQAFDRSGLTGFWQSTVETQCRQKPVHEAFDCAVNLIRLGEKEKAIEMLEAAVEHRNFILPYINVDPIWDSVRSDPRFTAVVAKMNLPAGEQAEKK